MVRLSRLCLPALLLLANSAFAYAQDTAAPAPATQSMSSAPAAADDPNEVICRKGQPVTGSRFPGPNVCHTRREWDDIHQQASDLLMHQQQLSGASNSTVGGP